MEKADIMVRFFLLQGGRKFGVMPVGEDSIWSYMDFKS